MFGKTAFRRKAKVHHQSRYSKPLLAIAVLLIAALACYSDSPVWPFEMTAAPPTTTPLPTPDANNPAKFAIAQTLLCPRPTAPGQAFCFVTRFPEELQPGVINASGSCEYNVDLEVLYVGRQSADIVYYLVACGGTVGWINENRLVGPVTFLRGQSALTTPVGAEGEVFPINSQEPPTPGPAVNCQVNEVVDILGVSGLPTGEIWYRIKCSGGTGWVEQNRIFGPLPLPSVGGLGMVLPSDAPTPLTSDPAAPTADNTVGECAPNSVINTLSAQRLGDQVYYQITCGDQTGWLPKEVLIEIPYPPGVLALVHVIAPEVPAEAAPAEDAAEEDTGEEGDGEQAQTGPIVLNAPMTENPEFAIGDNVVGECPSGTVVPINQITVADNQFFFQVTCSETTGWLHDEYVLAKVDYPLDVEVALTEAGAVGSGTTAGFYISDTPSRLLSDRGSIGACKLNTLGRILQVGFVEAALGGDVTIYYQISCQNADEASESTELTGWVDQSRLRPADALRATTQTNLIGG
jgi:hypothetical protein